MKKLFTFLAVLAGLWVAARPVLAHHVSRGATYDVKKQVTVKGTVTRFDWRNPHVVIYVDAKDADGKVVAWSFEDVNVSQLVQEGITRSTLKPGQEITAVFNPAVDGTRRGIIVKVILPDGEEIMSRVPRQNPGN
jgi:hypothetical protein